MTPLAHGTIDAQSVAASGPFGIAMIFFVGFGWAKPVPVNPYNLRHGSRAGYALVAAAGPASNLFLAALVGVLWRIGLFGAALQRLAVCLIFMSINVSLCLFNLIPLAPLDGSGVLGGLVGERGAQALASLQTYGPILLMGLFMLSYISPRFNILGGILSSGVNAVMRLLLGV